MDLQATLNRAFLDNAYWLWGAACAVALGCGLIALVARRIARKQYARMTATSTVEFVEIPLSALAKTSLFFIVILSLSLASTVLKLPERADRILMTVLTIVSFWQLGVWASAALLAWFERKRQVAMEHDRAAVGSLGIIGFVLRMVVWVIVLMLTLDNLGINVTTLVAGLGVGGIAVALAVQNVLGDLLASLSITLDRPFVVGDFLIVGDFLGTVEHIGIKSVRLRSLGGEQIIMPNAELLGSRVRNYAQMPERRIVFTLDVTYDTPPSQLRKIPGMVRAIIESQKETRFDRGHFAKFSSYSLSFEFVYYVLSGDYNRFMDIQQSINFTIFEAFEREHIQFAYPTQRLLGSFTQPAERELSTGSVQRAQPSAGGSTG